MNLRTVVNSRISQTHGELHTAGDKRGKTRAINFSTWVQLFHFDWMKMCRDILSQSNKHRNAMPSHRRKLYRRSFKTGPKNSSRSFYLFI